MIFTQISKPLKSKIKRKDTGSKHLGIENNDNIWSCKNIKNTFYQRLQRGGVVHGRGKDGGSADFLGEALDAEAAYSTGHGKGADAK